MDEMTFDALVIGSGAAGLAAACRLKEGGCRRVAVLTEDKNGGVSLNAGSDKQTYYKLGLGDGADSVRRMAEDLFACGACDGDNALAEAALSVRCFMYLTELDVPFPCSEYGEYIGYKTDHDPAARASSAGPLTSRFMAEALAKHAQALGVTLLDGLYVFKILTDEAGVCGVCALIKNGDFSVLQAPDVILATGGPAGVYADTVYPAGHTGSTALALFAVAGLQNMGEWQYGLATVAPRWNVSGSYMQVLPRFVSVDETGTEREFLTDYFPTVRDALNAVFLKGYQWPFDAAKAESGSSRVDLAVYNETVRLGRRVSLDYTRNPFGMDTLDLSLLNDEAATYLQKGGACSGTPYERLAAMNEPAVELYRSKGLDLAKNRARIALSAQHCNGGISVDACWQTDIPGLYAVGECAGTHGVRRPGGSALNAGQVGALRAAQSINTKKRVCNAAGFASAAAKAQTEHEAFLASVIKPTGNTRDLTRELQRRFSDVAAAVRDTEAFLPAADRLDLFLRDFTDTVTIENRTQAADAYRLRDTAAVQRAMLESMIADARTLGCSRGGAVCLAGGQMLPFRAKDTDRICTVRLEGGRYVASRRPVRPIPPEEQSFELMWKRFRERTVTE